MPYLIKAYRSDLSLSLSQNIKTVCVVIVTGFLCGVLAHPGMDGHGVAHNAMTPSVVLISLLVFYAVSTLSHPWKLFLTTLYAFEIGVFFYFAASLYREVYHLGKNLYYKTNNNLIFFHDILFVEVQSLAKIIFCMIMVSVTALMIKGVIGATAKHPTKLQ